MANVTSQNMLNYIQAVLAANEKGGTYTISGNPDWLKDALEIIKLAKQYSAKLEVIKFLEWFTNNGYEPSGPDHVTGEWLYGVIDGSNMSSEDLYEQYLHEKK